MSGFGPPYNISQIAKKNFLGGSKMGKKGPKLKIIWSKYPNFLILTLNHEFGPVLPILDPPKKFFLAIYERPWPCEHFNALISKIKEELGVTMICRKKIILGFLWQFLYFVRKKCEKVKIWKKSPKVQLLPDFQKLLTKLLGRPKAFKKWVIFFWVGLK